MLEQYGLMIALVCAVVAVVAMRFLYYDYRAGSIAFAGVPAWVCELIIPFAFAVLTSRYLLYTGEHLRALARPPNR